MSGTESALQPEINMVQGNFINCILHLDYKLITETQLKDKLTLWFELLEGVPPFAADDVETVIEGVTLELYE